MMPRFDPTDVRPVRLRFDALENRYQERIAWICFHLMKTPVEELREMLWADVPMNEVRAVIVASKMHGIKPHAAWATPVRVEVSLRILDEAIERMEARIRAISGEHAEVLQ